MTDIVERLSAPAYWISGSSEGHEGDNTAPTEAADTITTLRAENERLRAALDRIAKGQGDPVAVAVAALAQEKQ